ncbi:MAG: tRNA (N6-threonylcarbamoyladenosine(37)-N6)-methyltransferase TrmO [Candidatus Thorarchaeota archaeon]|nr:tRNA (N6-threonylcarbamoyladenosine(37)-N6)-methyltransferase TrmO [Candidatus Thorarchaeota archaeon]
MNIVILYPKMGIAGDMTAASLFDLLRKREEGAEALIDDLLAPFKSHGNVKIESQEKGCRLITSFQEPTITYSEARALQDKFIQSMKLSPSYAEISRNTLEILIEAESFVHRQEFMDAPTKWDPDKFTLPTMNTSTASQPTIEHVQDKPTRITPKETEENSREIRLTSIGVAHTPYVNRDAPNQPIVRLQSEDEKEDIHSTQFTIELQPQFTSALEDLAQFKYIYVVSYLDQTGAETTSQVIPPWDQTKTERGLFATRSPNRPNPIGISVVRLLQVKQNVLYVDSLDLFDGTPILDIKPYIYSIDSRAANNGWITDSDHLLLHRLGIVHSHSQSGTATTEGHLHEASDIIIDSVIPLKILELLKIPVKDTFLAAPLSLGGGKITFSHGTLRVPVPAVKYIIERYQIPSKQGPVELELATPTGVALLAALDIAKRQLPDSVMEQILQVTDASVVLRGKGFGTKTIPDHENALFSYLVHNAEGYLVEEHIAS